MSQRPIREVLEEHSERWLTMPGVVGTAVGECEGEACLTVYVAEKTDALAAEFPPVLDGFRVCLLEIGRIEPL